MGKNIRSVSKDGVTITVVSKQEGFFVTIDVDKGTIFSKKRKCELFCIKFQIEGKEKVAQQTMQFKLPRQEYPRQIIQNFKKRFTLQDGLSCTISLSPEFYLSKSLRKKYEELQAKIRERQIDRQEKERAKARDEAALKSFYKAGVPYGKINQISTTVPNSYTKTNAFRPYQGGGCSPK